METISAKLAELTELVAKQQGEIDKLQQENVELKKASVQPAPARTPAQDAAAPDIVSDPTQPVRSIAASFNPEIGVVADIVGQVSDSGEDSEGNDKISVRELHLVLGHDIDPYSRFDSTITFSDFHDPEIEEAYISHWGLPGDTKARLGRMRQRIGRASAGHRDELDTVDMPLFVQRYLGVEGLFRTGLELSNYLPTPWEAVAHEVILGTMEGGVGEDGTLFGDTRRRPSFYARLRNGWDISQSSALDFGGTYLVGSANDSSSYEVDAYGVDLTYTHFITPSQRLKFQSEAMFQDRSAGFGGSNHDHNHRSAGKRFRDEEAHDHDEHEEHDDGGIMESPFRSSPYGFYSLVDFRVNKQFSLGTRYDYVQPINIDQDYARSAERAVSGYLTFHQSEFARWRLQYQRAALLEGGYDDRFYLQATVAIGTHKHKLN